MACKMKSVLFLVAVICGSCLAASTLPENRLEEDEIPEMLAGVLEVFDNFGEDTVVDSDEAEDVIATTNSALGEDVMVATVNEDGDIEVEDMILSPDMFSVLFPSVDHPSNNETASVHKRAAIRSTSKLWPKATVHYAYNNNLKGSKTKVRDAMNEWEKHTCIKFRYRPSGSKTYTQIRTKYEGTKVVSTCSSSIGYYGKQQYINLAPNCFSKKTLLHEIGHTLGLIHEHQHPDRDKYVTILWNNINPKKLGNFKARSTVSSWGIPYDYASVMHYSSTAFRKPGCVKDCYTIQSKSGATITSRIGRVKALSPKSDIPIIKKMYSCKS